MEKDLRKRLEEAANGIYPISEIYNDLAMEFVDTNNGLREAFKDGEEVGIELGYKEAIKTAKEWFDKIDFTKYTFIVGGRELVNWIRFTEDFETNMNKLWEE